MIFKRIEIHIFGDIRSIESGYVMTTLNIFDAIFHLQSSVPNNYDGEFKRCRSEHVIPCVFNVEDRGGAGG